MLGFQPIQRDKKPNDSISSPKKITSSVITSTPSATTSDSRNTNPSGETIRSRKSNSGPTEEMVEVGIGKVYQEVLRLSNLRNDNKNSSSQSEEKDLLERIVYCEYFEKKPIQTCSKNLRSILFSCYKLLSAIYRNEGALEDAVDLLLAAVKLDCGDITVLHRLFTLTCNIERYDVSLWAVESALKLNPFHWPSLEMGILLLWAMLRFEDCLKLCQAALQKDQEYGIAFYCIQQILSYHSSLDSMLSSDIREKVKYFQVPESDEKWVATRTDKIRPIWLEKQSLNHLYKPPTIAPLSCLSDSSLPSMADFLARLIRQIEEIKPPACYLVDLTDAFDSLSECTQCMDLDNQMELDKNEINSSSSSSGSNEEDGDDVISDEETSENNPRLTRRLVSVDSNDNSTDDKGFSLKKRELQSTNVPQCLQNILPSSIRVMAQDARQSRDLELMNHMNESVIHRIDKMEEQPYYPVLSRHVISSTNGSDEIEKLVYDWRDAKYPIGLHNMCEAFIQLGWEKVSSLRTHVWSEKFREDFHLIVAFHFTWIPQPLPHIGSNSNNDEIGRIAELLLLWIELEAESLLPLLREHDLLDEEKERLRKHFLLDSISSADGDNRSSEYILFLYSYLENSDTSTTQVLHFHIRFFFVIYLLSTVKRCCLEFLQGLLDQILDLISQDKSALNVPSNVLRLHCKNFSVLNEDVVKDLLERLSSPKTTVQENAMEHLYHEEKNYSLVYEMTWKHIVEKHLHLLKTPNAVRIDT